MIWSRLLKSYSIHELRVASHDFYFVCESLKELTVAFDSLVAYFNVNKFVYVVFKNVILF